MPPGMEGMPPGMEGMPPEMGPEPQIPPGLIPSGPIQGPGGQVGAEPMGALAGLPPKVLEAILAQGG